MEIDSTKIDKCIEDLNNKDKLYIEQNWKKVPLPVLGQKFDLNQLETSIILRRLEISLEFKPIEDEYILENIDVKPHEVIRNDLQATKTQFAQRCEALGIKRLKSASDLNFQEVANKTKWLIEEKLELKINDELPSQISGKDFSNNSLSNCLTFAQTEKNKDQYYKNFSAVAYLICHAYPEKYRPFQFNHGKRNKYFTGPNGKKNILNAIMWVITEKLGHNLNLLAKVKDNKYFLRTKDLNYYGVGRHWYSPYFKSTKDIVREIIKIAKLKDDAKPFKTTRELRSILENEDINPSQCYYCSHEQGVHIHHIYPKHLGVTVGFDIDSSFNLIPVCPNHHAIIQDLTNEIDILKVDKQEWRNIATEYIKKKNSHV